MAIDLRKPVRREYRYDYIRKDGTVKGTFTEWHGGDRESVEDQHIHIVGGYMADVSRVHVERTGKAIY
jgi:hypothetical protein